MTKEKKWRIIQIIILCVITATGYGIFRHYSHFNQVVTERFEGKLWELPARVYARPMEIYMGMKMKPSTFIRELQMMEYIQVNRPVEIDAPGKFLRSGDGFSIYCRSFPFEDGESPAKKVQISIRRGKVDMLKDLDKKTFPDLIRLDPALIGSFYPIHNEDRVLVTLDDVPSLLTRTLLAVEDRNFYDHHGIAPLAVIRAMIANIRKRQVVQGASTLTQQLAKNFFLTNEKTLKRKIDEMFMAVALERNYEKDDILEAYLNEVYMGQDGKRAIHGFGLASRFYFGKSVRDLREHEIALLVGMLKGPSQYNPRLHPEKALARRNLVLKIMTKQGLIEPDVAARSIKLPSGVIKASAATAGFPAYLELVRHQLLREYREDDLRSSGLRIFTHFDPEIQAAAEKAATSELNRIESARKLPKGKLQTSIVVTSTSGNEVLALIGGRNPKSKGFNRAINAKRPIGSLIKPAVYLTALSHPEQYTLITQTEDSLMRVPDGKGGTWTPRNYDRKYHGSIPLYMGLVHSYNAATVRIGMDVGLDRVFDTLDRMGFTRETEPYPSALLGTVEMSPLEVAQIYQTIASGGFYSPIRAIRAVYKPDGESLQRYPLTLRQNLDPGPIYLINKILQAVVVEGTGRSLKKWVNQDLGAAGKTGTSNDLKDSWFAGFTGDKLAVVWVGRDDNRPCGLTGASGALKLWGRVMSQIPNSPLKIPRPEEVEWVVIDSESGMRTDRRCENAIAVPFIKGSAPYESISCASPAIQPAVREEKKKPKSAFMRWLKDLF